MRCFIDLLHDNDAIGFQNQGPKYTFCDNNKLPFHNKLDQFIANAFWVEVFFGYYEVAHHYQLLITRYSPYKKIELKVCLSFFYFKTFGLIKKNAHLS